MKNHIYPSLNLSAGHPVEMTESDMLILIGILCPPLQPGTDRKKQGYAIIDAMQAKDIVEPGKRHKDEDAATLPQQNTRLMARISKRRSNAWE